MVKTLRSYLFVAMMVLATVLAGCGGGGSSSTATSEDTPEEIIPAYGYVYDQRSAGEEQTVVIGADVNLAFSGPLKGVTHEAGSSVITVSEAGVYNVAFSCNTMTSGTQDWGIVVNGEVQQKFESKSQTLPLASAILTLDANDTISLRNLGTKDVTLPSDIFTVWLQIDKVGNTYGYVFDNRGGVDQQEVPVDADVAFNGTGPLQGLSHAADSSDFIVSEAGTYNFSYAFYNTGFNYRVNWANSNKWGLAVNGNLHAFTESRGQTGAGSMGLALQAGDIVSLRSVGAESSYTRPVDANSAWLRGNKLDGFHGYVTQIGFESVPVGSEITWSDNGPLQGVSHTAGTAAVTVDNAGTYKLNFGLYTTGSQQRWGLVVNGEIVQKFGTAGQSFNIGTMLVLAEGDQVALRNLSSNLDLRASVGNDNITAYMQIEQVE